MAWSGGIVLDVAAQTYDEIINGPGISVFVQSPDFLEDRFAGNHSSLVADEVPEEFRFHQGELDGVVVHTQLQFAEVDGPAVKRERVVFGGLGGTRGRALAHPVAAAQQSL